MCVRFTAKQFLAANSVFKNSIIGCAGARSRIQTKLLTDTELSDDCSVALNVDLCEVVEQASSLANHLQQTTAGVVILLVCTEVLGEVVDSLSENCDLNFRRTVSPS